MRPPSPRTVIGLDRITASSATSGIDFAFRVIEHRCGRDVAEGIQLALEYDPEPLGGGNPATARAEVLAAVKGFMAQRMGGRATEIAAVAAGR